MHTLRTRILLTYLLVSGLVLVLVSISMLVFMLRNPYASQLVYRRLDATADTMLFRGAPSITGARAENLQRNLTRIDQAIGIRLLVLGKDGTLLADSRAETAKFEPDAFRDIPSLDQPMQGEFRDVASKRWLVVGRPLEDGNYLLLTLPRPTLGALSVLREDYLPALLQAGAVALVASVLASWLISRWVADPLQHISRAARAVGQVDYSLRPDPAGPKEVQSVAMAFGEMMQRVNSSQQSQRDFVANVSHELKTPLTSIQGFAQAILDGTADDPQAQQHAAQVIYDETDRLRRLVEDLLDLARLDAGQVSFKRKPLDLSALVRNVAEKLSLPAKQKGVQLVVNIPSLPRMVGDGDRLAQVFTNLVDNAIKHTPPGSTVTLTAEVEGSKVLTHVVDTGSGIPPDELSRIFERFYQLDKSRSGGRGRGAGLGLSIAREIVHAHGGRVVALSKVGHGSRFTVELPVILPDDATLVRPEPGGSA